MDKFTLQVLVKLYIWEGFGQKSDIWLKEEDITFDDLFGDAVMVAWVLVYFLHIILKGSVFFCFENTLVDGFGVNVDWIVEGCEKLSCLFDEHNIEERLFSKYFELLKQQLDDLDYPLIVMYL